MSESAGLPFMSPLARHIRGLTGTAYEDLELWPKPDEGGLGDKTTRYLLRKRAVCRYLEGASDEELRRSFSLSRKRIYQIIVGRCLRTHSDGLIYGWRGLVPNLRIEPYKRKRKIAVDAVGRGAAGAMQTTLDLNPELREAFEVRILAVPREDELAQKHSRRSHWRWFLMRLREKGYQLRNEWPFNTENTGYVSVCRYIDAVLKANPRAGAVVLGGKEAKRKLKSGDGVNRPVDRVFQRVEMDGHKIDGRFCILLPRGDGSYVERIVHRLWVIVLLEVYSRSVIGYHFSYRYELSRDDVLRAIKKALTVWRRRPLVFGDVQYCEGAALPSGREDKYIGVCWDETSIDGALAESCRSVRSVLKNIVGADLIEPSSGFSARRSKDDRPYIEAFFKNLASRGFHKLSNTTGGKPKDKKGNNPEKVAIASRFQVEYAEDLVDALIANYNASPHSGLGDRSPLEYLDFISSRPGIPGLRHADPNEVQCMLSYRKLCKVRGSLAEGRRPYVNFSNARYHGDALDHRFDLIGKKIWVENHIEDDARVALAYAIDGKSLGVLRAAPPWHRTPHSLQVRSAIVACSRRNLFRLLPDRDAIQAFHAFYEANGGKLPPHPMFLESRRILAQYGELHLRDTVLAAAKAELDAEAGEVEKKHGPPTSDQTVIHPTQLPARRKARTA